MRRRTRWPTTPSSKLALLGLACAIGGLFFPPLEIVAAVALEASTAYLVAGVALDGAVAIDKTMIHLEEFNRFDSFFDFEPISGEATSSPRRDEHFFGYLSILQSGLVAALYRKADVLTLQIGLEIWHNNPGFRTSYQHRDGGTTVFTLLQDETPVYEYTYPSWWQRPDSFFNVAEGSPPDEEEDYLAYVHYNFEFERAGKKRDLVWHSVE